MANQVKFGETTFSVGDKVRVYQKIQEGDKIRTQPFEGIVISIRGEGDNRTFTIRKIATGGVGVEHIWPLNSPWIEKLRVIKKGKVRRAKLYFLRHQPSEIKFAHEEKEPRQPRRRTSRKTIKK